MALNSKHASTMNEDATGTEAKRNVRASVHPATCPEDSMYRRMMFWLLVTAQFIIAATIVLSLKSAFSQIGTALMALLGIASGIWAIVSMGRKTVSLSPALRSTAQLAVNGPYRFVRHPMYTALLMFCGAFVLCDSSIFGWLLYVALVFILVIKMAYEEAMLKRRFSEYGQYAAKVKRLVPFIL